MLVSQIVSGYILVCKHVTIHTRLHIFVRILQMTKKEFLSYAPYNAQWEILGVVKWTDLVEF